VISVCETLGDGEGGITYLTLIQAKDWAKAVDQGEALKFKAILDDIPGQPRGLSVARSGFQTGAEEVARGNGIKALRTSGGRYQRSTTGADYLGHPSVQPEVREPGSDSRWRMVSD